MGDPSGDVLPGPGAVGTGRALAGAQGNEEARIFCREFHAELVAVAGHYKVLEDIPAELRGKPVQVWLEKGQLKLAALD